jgi:ketosteroid isomerase-like protein
MKIAIQRRTFVPRRFVSSWVVLAIAAWSGCAPPLAQEPIASAAEVEAAFAAFTAAWEQEDLEAAVGVFAPDAIVFDPVPPGKFDGIEEIRGWTSGSFDALEQISITVEDLQIQTAGPVAWVTAQYRFDALQNGEPSGDEGNLSMVWVRQPEGVYKATLFHASRLPEAPSD